MHTKLTLGSVWSSITGQELDDELLTWPPDVFAFAALILDRTAVHRFAFSAPPRGDWADRVTEAGEQWGALVEDWTAEPPELLNREWNLLRAAAATSIEALASGGQRALHEALLTVHAIADEACAGLGITFDAASPKGGIYRAQARELLARTGSLARIAPERLRVLPKVRTTPNGTTAAALARYACVVGPKVEVRWHKLPTRRHGLDPRSDHVNILLLPWPLRVRESDFRPLEGSVQRRNNEPFGLFEFAPSEALDLDLLDRTLQAARDEVDSVDVVYLPESAVDCDEIAGLEALLDQHGVVFLSTGVRERSSAPGRLPGNGLHIGVNPRLQKGAPGSTGEPWIHVRQNKHHRWSLDERQIYQYHLGGALHPAVRWWEAIDVPRPCLNVLEVGEGVVLVYLVCEDLAKHDDVAEVVRHVGPTVVTTHVLDGPQLATRWGARYASVLADDPGSAVLTLTSRGMVRRSRPRGREISSVIAMWKDPIRGIREIPIDDDAHGVLLTGVADGTNRRSNDGRPPVGNSTHFFDVAIHQVRAAPVASPQPAPLPTMPALDAVELTILTSWAEALAEALDGAPGRASALLAAAREGAAWRVRLGIAEPGERLRDALEALRLPVAAPGLAGRVLEYAIEARAARKARQA